MNSFQKVGLVPTEFVGLGTPVILITRQEMIKTIAKNWFLILI
jgi:hypothetical protein